MPPITAPKKVAKKAAKKVAKKQTPEHDHERMAKDTRRSYEHLGRVEMLSSLVEGEHSATVQELVHLARAAVSANQAKDGADLLRAAEHLCFGLALKGKTDDKPVSKELQKTIQEEHQHLLDKAGEHAARNEMPSAVQTIFTLMTKASVSSMKGKSYRSALEMARGAEAVAHVKNKTRALPPSTPSKLLN